MGQFFTLRTHHQTVVVEDRRSATVVSMNEQDMSAESPALLAYVSNAKPDGCFLVSHRGARLNVEPRVTGVGVVALGLARGTGHTASLYDPWTGRWACAVPLNEEAVPKGRLVLMPDRVDAYERLTLVPVGSLHVPEAALTMAARLERCLALPFHPDMVAHVGPNDGPVLEACFRLLPATHQRAFAEALARSPAAAKALAALFPDDLMGTHGIAELACWLANREAPKAASPPAIPRSRLLRWLPGRRQPGIDPRGTVVTASPPAQRATLGQSFDPMATKGLDGAYVSLPHAVTTFARQSVKPSKDLCIVASARNEGIYYLEWLAHHRAIGVQQVFLYTNNNDDGSDELLTHLANAGEIRWFGSVVGDGYSPQFKAYAHTLSCDPEVLDYRWALFIDLDEYLCFNPGLFGSALSLLNWYDAKGADAVALNWVIHGSGGEARWRDAANSDRFPFTLDGPAVLIKTVCRPGMFFHSWPHFPIRYHNEHYSFMAANGLRHVPNVEAGGLAFSTHPTSDTAWISHYFYRSAEEFLWKWSRNRGDLAIVQGDTTSALTPDFVHRFMQQFPATDQRGMPTTECAPGYAAEYARLLSLPGVADAQAMVVERFQARMRTITPLFLEAPGIVQAGQAGQELMSLLGLQAA